MLDREFRYEGLLEAAQEEGVQFVVRLNVGSHATITDEEGKKVTLVLRPGERVVYRGVYDKGKVRGHVAGE